MITHIIPIAALLLGFFYQPVLQREKVAFFGNSLVRVGPNVLFDWYANWGMAATSPDKDFAHLLVKKLEAGNGPVEYLIASTGGIEFFPEFQPVWLYELKDFKPDILIVRIGDNVPSDAARLAAYETNLGAAIDYAVTTETLVICTGSWYPRPDIDIINKRVCDARHARYVDIADMVGVPTYLADSERNFTYAPVGTHPGDVGHAEIARRIYEAIVMTPTATQEPTATATVTPMPTPSPTPDAPAWIHYFPSLLRD